MKMMIAMMMAFITMMTKVGFMMMKTTISNTCSLPIILMARQPQLITTTTTTTAIAQQTIIAVATTTTRTLVFVGPFLVVFLVLASSASLFVFCCICSCT